MGFREVRLESWDDIRGYRRKHWLFRGQACADWELSTSLERCCDRHSVPSNARPHIERELLREFRRKYHHYSYHAPAPEFLLEWQSIMQHHGAPTRLLDFTYSMYVAAYFALETAERDCAVWGLDGEWALTESVERFGAKQQQDLDLLKEPFTEKNERCFQTVFLDPPSAKAVCPLNPFRLDRRLTAQQGVFLVPGDISASFMDNLRALPGHDDPRHLAKIIIPNALRAQGIRNLFEMNISRTSLFPELDGYAQSLGVFHPVFDGD